MPQIRVFGFFDGDLEQFWLHVIKNAEIHLKTQTHYLKEVIKTQMENTVSQSEVTRLIISSVSEKITGVRHLFNRTTL